MCNPPAFLPPMLNLNGTWEEVLEKLHTVFKKDFIESNIYYENLKVIFDKRKIDGDKEEGFWHLITRGRPGERVPDYKRAKRLPWAKPTIAGCNHSEVKAWSNLEDSGEIRIYLWIENHDYVIILEKGTKRRKHQVVLVTSFYVEGWKKNDLMRRYNKRITTSL